MATRKKTTTPVQEPAAAPARRLSLVHREMLATSEAAIGRRQAEMFAELQQMQRHHNELRTLVGLGQDEHFEGEDGLIVKNKETAQGEAADGTGALSLTRAQIRERARKNKPAHDAAVAADRVRRMKLDPSAEPEMLSAEAQGHVDAHLAAEAAVAGETPAEAGEPRA